MQITPKARLMLLCQRLSNHYTTTNHSCCFNTNIVAALYAGSWHSQRISNHYTTTNHTCCFNTNILAALYAGSWYRQRLSNHHTTTDYFCCNIIKGTTSTTRWLFANTLYGWREYPFLVITFTSASLFAGASTAGVVVRFLLVHLLLPDFPQAESHPEPAPRSLRRRISPAQTKGEYQYED